jgi:integrative and conjugative element protein (TIGR02256 family)
MRAEVALSTTARDVIAVHARECLPSEVGGILLGYREDNRIVVADVLTVQQPGASTHRYVRDDVAANQQLRRWLSYREPDDPVGYVGEWHSHPAPVGPSRRDIASIRATARAAHDAIALLVHCPKEQCDFTALIAARRRWARVYVGAVPVVPAVGRCDSSSLLRDR